MEMMEKNMETIIMGCIRFICGIVENGEYYNGLY